MSGPDEVQLGVLGHQSLRRSLTETEKRLAVAIEAAFATGQQDFAGVVQFLQREGVARPSGESGPWTLQALESELQLLNASLDQAYLQNPVRT